MLSIPITAGREKVCNFLRQTMLIGEKVVSLLIISWFDIVVLTTDVQLSRLSVKVEY